MRRNNGLLTRFASATELELELQPKLPIVELAGENRVLIENHQSVIGYGRQEIRVKVKYGFIAIKGDCLELAKLSKEQLIIVGKICGIELCRRGA